MSDQYIQQRMSPQNIEAEQSILGAIMLENDAIDKAVELINPADFYATGHRLIFEAMTELSATSTAIDITTLPEHLRKKGELEKCNGVSYLATLVNTVPNAANIRYHCRIVKEKAILRFAISAATDIIGLAYDCPDVDEVREKAGAAFFAMADKPFDEGFRSARELAERTYQVTEQRAEQKSPVTGVPTGYKRLDRLTAGLQHSDLVIIAGRPSQGKTALAVNIAHNAAVAGVPSGIFSLEMSSEALMQRLVCGHALLDSERVRTGYLSGVEWESYTKAMSEVSELPIYIADNARLSLFDIITRSRRLKREKNVGMIIIDHLGFVRTSKRGKFQQRNEEVGEITRSLKGLAKDLKIPVVLLCQLNRGLESRTDRRPILADLRESGDIEQDADLIMFLYRDEFYKHCQCPHDGECVCGQRGKAEAIIGKQRNGRIGKAELYYHGPATCFIDKEETSA